MKILLFLVLGFSGWAKDEAPVHILRDPLIFSTVARFTSASYSPDGSKIVTASEYGLTRVWNSKTYALARVLLAGPYGENLPMG